VEFGASVSHDEFSPNSILSASPTVARIVVCALCRCGILCLHAVLRFCIVLFFYIRRRWQVEKPANVELLGSLV